MTKNYKEKGGGGLQENWLPINCQWGGGSMRILQNLMGD